MKKGCILFFRNNYTCFLPQLHCEFDKNANSIYVIVVMPFHIKFVERQSEFAFFVRWLRLRTFLFMEDVL